jgi:hypothetical protein
MITCMAVAKLKVMTCLTNIKRIHHDADAWLGSTVSPSSLMSKELLVFMDASKSIFPLELERDNARKKYQIGALKKQKWSEGNGTHVDGFSTK